VRGVHPSDRERARRSAWEKVTPAAVEGAVRDALKSAIQIGSKHMMLLLAVLFSSAPVVTVKAPESGAAKVGSAGALVRRWDLAGRKVLTLDRHPPHAGEASLLITFGGLVVQAVNEGLPRLVGVDEETPELGWC